jgi:hypothetical protein
MTPLSALTSVIVTTALSALDRGKGIPPRQPPVTMLP